MLNVYNNNPPTKSLSSIFRSFTETNLNENKCPLPDGPPFANGVHLQQVQFTSIPLDTLPAGSLNFDLANVNYEPCHRDMADADFHHILSDNLFKPVKRVRVRFRLVLTINLRFFSNSIVNTVRVIFQNTPTLNHSSIKQGFRCDTWWAKIWNDVDLVKAKAQILRVALADTVNHRKSQRYLVKVNNDNLFWLLTIYLPFSPSWADHTRSRWRNYICRQVNCSSKISFSPKAWTWRPTSDSSWSKPSMA